MATNEVALVDDDDFLRIFSELEVQSSEALQWLEQFFLSKTMPELHDREGFDEMLDKLLSRLPPESILRRFKPEERLQGLSPEEAILALPEQVLRALPQDYLRTLPEPVQTAIRERLGRQ